MWWQRFCEINSVSFHASFILLKSIILVLKSFPRIFSKIRFAVNIVKGIWCLIPRRQLPRVRKMEQFNCWRRSSLYYKWNIQNTYLYVRRWQSLGIVSTSFMLYVDKKIISIYFMSFLGPKSRAFSLWLLFPNSTPIPNGKKNFRLVFGMGSSGHDGKWTYNGK